MEKGKLYLVATPIGNLEDMTFRAINILKFVDVIAAEDTRQTLKLLNHFEISKTLVSYHRHNEEIKSKELIERINNGQNIAIVTDAGTPGISDPGEEIVKECIKSNIKVVPIPGACAAINALICSGFGTKEFAFYGFLPLNKKNRREKIDEILEQNKTIILYEAPHRIIDTLKEIEKNFGDIEIVVAKELTKIHENFYRGRCKEIIEQIGIPRGEFIIMFENHATSKQEKEIESLNQLSLDEQFEYYKNKGMAKKDIIKTLAKNNKASKNEIYIKFLETD